MFDWWDGISFLSIVTAAACTSGERSSRVWPRATIRSRKDVAILMKSLLLFCFLYLRSSPVISPFKQLGGCADDGGM